MGQVIEEEKAEEMKPYIYKAYAFFRELCMIVVVFALNLDMQS